METISPVRDKVSLIQASYQQSAKAFGMTLEPKAAKSKGNSRRKLIKVEMNTTTKSDGNNALSASIVTKSSYNQGVPHHIPR